MPGYTAWRNWFLRIDSTRRKHKGQGRDSVMHDQKKAVMHDRNPVMHRLKSCPVLIYYFFPVLVRFQQELDHVKIELMVLYMKFQLYASMVWASISIN